MSFNLVMKRQFFSYIRRNKTKNIVNYKLKEGLPFPEHVNFNIVSHIQSKGEESTTNKLAKVDPE